MSFWRGLVDGVVQTITTVTAYQLQVPQFAANAPRTSGRIERLCRDVGWTIDARGEDSIHLHFSNDDGETRIVVIVGGDNGLATFAAVSAAVIPENRLPPEVMAYLLLRNSGEGGIGRWGMSTDERNDVRFHNVYQAIGNGLDPSSFKWICESLVAEAAHFDGMLRRAQLLR